MHASRRNTTRCHAMLCMYIWKDGGKEQTTGMYTQVSCVTSRYVRTRRSTIHVDPNAAPMRQRGCAVLYCTVMHAMLCRYIQPPWLERAGQAGDLAAHVLYGHILNIPSTVARPVHMYERITCVRT